MIIDQANEYVIAEYSEAEKYVAMSVLVLYESVLVAVIRLLDLMDGVIEYLLWVMSSVC